MHVLDSISFKVNLGQMLKEMRLSNKQRLSEEFAELANEAESIAHPRALFFNQEISERGESHVILGGERLESRVLRVNLDTSRIAFPALATCGTELNDWVDTKDNILHQFWAKSIANAALSAAVAAMEFSLKDKFRIKTTSLMTPGSVSDWPISQQKILFNLFGDSANRIGVKLTDSFLMTPLSTISCLVFESETRFFSCQLCPRTDCQSRRADYDELLLNEKYQIHTGDNHIGTSICQT